MVRIDAHQHFWNYDAVKHSWMTEQMSVLRHDFLPERLETLLRNHGIDGCIAVQTDQSEEETRFLLGLAERYCFIKAVVGWIDLTAESLEEKLQDYRAVKKLVGFRHLLQGEIQRDYMLRDEFFEGIAQLQKYDYAYDLVIHADQLKYIPGLVKAFPTQRFMLDHLAKPDIKSRIYHQWVDELQEVSCFPNVYCKVSGMVTEADWKKWKQDDFTPYLYTALSLFGADRIVYGSDWPVCLLSASYDQTIKIVEDYFSQFDSKTQAAFFGGNAEKFYKLN